MDQDSYCTERSLACWCLDLGEMQFVAGPNSFQSYFYRRDDSLVRVWLFLYRSCTRTALTANVNIRSRRRRLKDNPGRREATFLPEMLSTNVFRTRFFENRCSFTPPPGTMLRNAWIKHTFRIHELYLHSHDDEEVIEIRESLYLALTNFQCYIYIYMHIYVYILASELHILRNIDVLIDLHHGGGTPWKLLLEEKNRRAQNFNIKLGMRASKQ